LKWIEGEKIEVGCGKSKTQKKGLQKLREKQAIGKQQLATYFAYRILPTVAV